MNMFAGEPPDLYRGFERVLVAQKRIEAALEVAEQGRAKAFVNLLATRLAAEPKFQLPIVPPSIKRIKQIAEEQKSTLVQYSLFYDYDQLYQHYRFHRGFNQPYSYASELFIWAIAPTGKVTFRQVDLKTLWHKNNTTLAGIVRSVRDAIVLGSGYDAESTKDDQLQLLYQFLIQPIADLLPTDPDDRVTFIPQDFLFLVPFAALLDPNGKYLIEKHTIFSVPAIQVFDFTERQCEKASAEKEDSCSGLLPGAERPFLVVGNPTMPSICLQFGEPPIELASLPGAEIEATAIAALLNTEVLTGDKATKAAAIEKLPNAAIVHLATYGFLDDVEGLRCAIALAPSSNDNGLLTVREILNLHLCASLVVLSGCYTSRGRIWGDGVIGLSRAFLAAGVPSAIVSLWLPPAAPTTYLMTEFYKHLLKAGDKAQALRSAILKTMQQYPDPRDWAAFTLMGEAQ